MSASTAAMPSSTSMYNNRAFWERQWRGSGIIFVALFIVGYVLYGSQPGVGASADALAAFYGGHRMRILIAATASGLDIQLFRGLTDACRERLTVSVPQRAAA